MNTPEKLTEIRRDLWEDMDPKQLNDQRELIMDKINLLLSMMGGNANPTVIGLYTVMQHALGDISSLIEQRTGGNKFI